MFRDLKQKLLAYGLIFGTSTVVVGFMMVLSLTSTAPDPQGNPFRDGQRQEVQQ